MINQTTFKINDTTKINLVLPCKEDELDCCSEIKIVLEHGDQKLLLFDKSDIRYALEPLKVLLNEALTGDGKLHESIAQQDIGYLWNEEIHGTVALPVKEGALFWVGEHHLLWESSSKIATWIYNKGDSIIFEITPVYKSNQLDENNEPISYTDWLKKYHPIMNIEIDKNTARRWLEQTESILNVVETNISLQP